MSGRGKKKEVPAWLRGGGDTGASGDGDGGSRGGASGTGAGASGGRGSRGARGTAGSRDARSRPKSEYDVRMDRALESQRRTRQALERALQTAAETEEMGASTLEELAVQRETLERSHKKVKDVQHMNKTSKWLLRGMSSFTGRIRNMFSGPPKHPDDVKREKAEKAAKAKAAKAAKAAARGGGGGGSAGAGGGGGGPQWPPPGYEDAGTNGERRRRGGGGGYSGGGYGGGGGGGAGSAGGGGGGGTQLQRNRAQEDAMLAELGHGVARLKAIAVTAGEELDGQNRMLDDISADVDEAHAGMAANRRAARRLT